jgi:translation initiation factor IF-2
MRARGAQVTDIAIIVLQLMMISCRKPKAIMLKQLVLIIFAINKIDKPNAIQKN